MGPVNAPHRIVSYLEQPYMNMLSANEVGLPVERDKPILEASESNLIATVLDPACRTLLITAPNSGCGGTTSALTLARQLALSSAGKVLLVDASPSPRGLTSLFQLNGAPGLLDLLAGDDMPERLGQCVYPHPDQPFDVLPLGVPQGRNRHLPHERIPQLFSALSADYRFVVIDGEAIYSSSYSLGLAARVDGVILVVRGEETRWEVAQAAVQRLRQANANLLGSIFNARRYYTPKWLYRYL